MSSRDTTRSSLSRRLRTSTRLPRIRRRKGAVGTHLETVDRQILGSPWMWSPTMSVAVVEDTCWALARDCWHARKPPMWRLAARRAWRAEYAQLAAKRERVVELLDEAG